MTQRTALATLFLILGCSTNVDLAGERQKANPGGEDSGNQIATGGASNGGAATTDSGGAAVGSGGVAVGSGGAAVGGGGTPMGSGGAVPTSNDGAPLGVATDGGCQAGPSLPLDLYVMFDQSSSLSAPVANSNPPTTWWQAAQHAVAMFVQSPRALGTGVGIQFFPFGGSIEGPDPNIPSSSCYVPNYVTPEVEIGELPGAASTIIQAIEQHAPTTFTPTSAALRGAIEHMRAWGPAHPGRQPAVVLVTDGYPTECDPQDPIQIAQIAQGAYDGTPRILTYLVGLESGGSLANLNPIAAAGGTGRAYLIHGDDVGAQLAEDMLGISTGAPSCSP